MSEADKLSQQTPLGAIEELSRTFLAHLYGLDAKECLDLFAPDITFVGSVQHMNANGLDEARQLIDRRAKSFKPAPLLSCENLFTTEIVPNVFCVASNIVIAPTTYTETAHASSRTVTLVWDTRSGQPLLRHVHLSAPLPAYVETENVRLSRDSYIRIGRVIEQRVLHASITVRDVSGTMHYVLSSEVRSIEACKQRTILHCLDRSIVVRRGFKDMVDEFGDDLVVVHRSFAVNPLYVRAIRGDAVVLDDGSIVPVPQRRSAEVRHDLSEAVQRMAESFKLRDITPPGRLQVR